MSNIGVQVEFQFHFSSNFFIHHSKVQRNITASWLTLNKGQLQTGNAILWSEVLQTPAKLFYITRNPKELNLQMTNVNIKWWLDFFPSLYHERISVARWLSMTSFWIMVRSLKPVLPSASSVQFSYQQRLAAWASVRSPHMESRHQLM